MKKLRTLHRHGVPHFWILDPEHHTLLVYRFGPESYAVALTAGIDEVVRAEPFDAIEIDVGTLFGVDRA